MSQGVCYYFVQTMMNTVTVVTNTLHCELGPNMLEKLTEGTGRASAYTCQSNYIILCTSLYRDMARSFLITY